MPAVQFHTPYSVLPTHEPSPVQEILHRPGVDGRVQNMLVFVQEWLAEQSTEAPSCTMMALAPEVIEQLCGPSQLSEVLASGGAVGQPLHMHRRGLEGMGPSCMEQLIADGDGGGHEVAKGELDTPKAVRPDRLSNKPNGKLFKTKLLLRSISVMLLGLSNAPTGRLVRPFLLRLSSVRLVRPSNTPAGRLERAPLPIRLRLVRQARLSNTPAGRLVKS